MTIHWPSFVGQLFRVVQLTLMYTLEIERAQLTVVSNCNVDS
jgi:hypothetical protein